VKNICGPGKFGYNNRMKWLLSLITVVFGLMPVGIASATMTIRGFSAANNERFYTGTTPPKAFIGEDYDWSGVGRKDVTGFSRWVTMISPSYFVSAMHYAPGIGGASVKFFYGNDPNGGFETRSVSERWQIDGSDLCLGKLSSPVSSNVAKYPILDLPSLSDYNNRIIYTYGLSVEWGSETATTVRLGRNNIDPYSFYDRTVEGTTGFCYLFDYDTTGGQGNDESRIDYGDSGGPSFTIVNGIPTLVGIHWFKGTLENGTPVSGDTFIPNYIDDIKAKMFGSGESLQTLVPEPGAMMLLASGMLACFLWSFRRRLLGR
jgi:hypothetical protein